MPGLDESSRVRAGASAAFESRMPVMLSVFPRAPARAGLGPDGEEALGVHGEGSPVVVLVARGGLGLQRGGEL
jgi:hypothetical protein